MAFVHDDRLGDSSNSLSGVFLPNQTRWLDQYLHVPYTIAAATALNGARDYVYRSKIAQQEITLDITMPRSVLKHERLEALRALDVPGAQLVLDWEGVQYTVIFNQLQPPAINFLPLDQVNGAPVWNTGLHTGQLRLVTI